VEFLEADMKHIRIIKDSKSDKNSNVIGFRRGVKY